MGFIDNHQFFASKVRFWISLDLRITLRLWLGLWGNGPRKDNKLSKVANVKANKFWPQRKTLEGILWVGLKKRGLECPWAVEVWRGSVSEKGVRVPFNVAHDSTSCLGVDMRMYVFPFQNDNKIVQMHISVKFALHLLSQKGWQNRSSLHCGKFTSEFKLDQSSSFWTNPHPRVAFAKLLICTQRLDP